MLVPALGAERVPVGITSGNVLIEAMTVMAGSLSAQKIVLLGDGRTIRQELQRYEALDDSRRRFDVYGVIIPSKTRLTLPPTGVAYRDQPEAHYIWRWIGLQAPDLVLVEDKADAPLTAAFSNNIVAGMGRIPARVGNLSSLKGEVETSEAHQELLRRLNRKPRTVLDQLTAVYGHEFSKVSYIEATALLVRMRAGQLADVERLATPYRDRVKPTLDNADNTNIGAHFLFAELADLTGDPRYTQLAERAADIAALDSLHEQMSDSVFMSCPLLAATGKLTGDFKYAEAAVRHWKLIAGYDLRPDNLYRHSPSTEAAWGRGNAFVALGLALTLTNMPVKYTGSEDLLKAYLALCSVLARNQDEKGMWREVIDYPGSYSELSATAMIGTAMLRGVRSGWLDEQTFMPKIERAWRAVLARTAADGKLIDVCESTGKQKAFTDYLNRAASLGKDDRGGAMVLMFAAEMAGLR